MIQQMSREEKYGLFAGSKNDGEATAIWLSLIQTCRAMGINPFDLLDDVLRRINATKDLGSLLPDRWKQNIQKQSRPFELEQDHDDYEKTTRKYSDKLTIELLLTLTIKQTVDKVLFPLVPLLQSPSLDSPNREQT